MGLGLLLVPALAGYILQTQLHTYRFRTLRESGQHVVFRSALTGSVLLLLAQLSVDIVNRYIPVPVTYVNELFGSEYTAAALLSFFFALAVWPVVNRHTTKDSAAIRAAQENGELKGVFVTEAIDTCMTVEVSLNTGKVYIGMITQSGIGMSSQFDFMIVPTYSGFRNRETNELEITQYYSHAIKKMIDEDQDWRKLSIGISISDVVSVRFFYPELYRESSNDEEPGE